MLSQKTGKVCFAFATGRKMKSVRSRDIVKIHSGVVQMSILRLCECRIKQSGVSHPGITPVKPNLLSVIRQYLRLAQK